MLNFSELSEREVLALAVSLEEDDARFYRDLSEVLREDHPASAKLFDAMAVEEDGHRHRLLDLYRTRFGDHIPLLRRGDIKGFVHREPIRTAGRIAPDDARERAAIMEAETRRFYLEAATRSSDASTRQLLGDLAAEEGRHEAHVEHLEAELLPHEVQQEEHETLRRLFVLRYVQPGLAGLMDGSVSTLAPLFAAAFATHSSWETFLVGIAAALGAGISMGFAEALSDDGSLTGRGSPWMRGGVCGLMTTVGGLGHALPYLLPSFTAATILAALVVVLELIAIAWIRNKYMHTPLLPTLLQVVLGGVLVFAVGVLIGSA
ncbi:iron exporter MbfA [Rhodovarius lipocyclicus]|uniref:iron exporter MbfA n=1 Tax=Rhodovarius lipocyclicus TaxID=268410 RepID=UPI0013578BCB|nr:ferritin family protein [Rhodovarius lipocyclicus]